MTRAARYLLLPSALVAQWLSWVAPSLVEHAYSRGLYPFVAGALGGVASLFPFALAEPLAVVLLVAVGVAVRRRRGERLVFLATLAGAGYLAFLLLWGFNYSRWPLSRTLALDVRARPLDELRALAAELVDEANAERAGVAEDADGVMHLPGGRRQALASAREALAGGARPKPALLSPLLSRLGISGIFIPFTGEPLVNVDQPDSEIPFSAAHELQHQRGIAREDEANYLAIVSCRAARDPAFRYSGAFAASGYALQALQRDDAAGARALAGRRSPAVKRDVGAIRAYLARVRGPLLHAGERVNDAYLKAQGQAGISSYGAVVDLLLAERRAGGGATLR